MAVNIPTTTIEGAIAAKVGNVDPTTPVLDLRTLQKYASDVGAEALYDSAGALPESTDANAGSTYFVKGATPYDGNSLYLSIGSGVNFQLQDANTPRADLLYQGSSYGFSTVGPAVTAVSTYLEQYSFSTGVTATSLGQIAPTPEAGSPAAAFRSARGGVTDTGKLNAYITGSDTTPAKIWKFSLVSATPVNLVGELTNGQYSGTNSSDVRNGFGYTAGGVASPNTYVNTIDKFSFATETNNAVDAGDASETGHFRGSGVTDTINAYGYAVGGYSGPGLGNVTATIDRYPFSTFTTSTDIGDLSGVRFWGVANSSTTHGYHWGGKNQNIPSNAPTQVDRFPFVTPFVTATSVGDIPSVKQQQTSSSSNDHMYKTWGQPLPGAGVIATIERFPFANEPGTSESVGNLSPVAPTLGSPTAGIMTGHQY